MIRGSTSRLRMIVIILIILLVLPGFGKCQQSSSLRLEISEPAEIDFWYYYNGEQEKALQKLLETFAGTVGEEIGIKVNYAQKGTSGELSAELVGIAASGGNLPDLFSVYPDAAWEINKYGRLLPLNSLLSESDLEVFPETYLIEGRLAGDQDVYLLPLAKASEVVAVNIDGWQKFAAENSRYENAADVFSSWETIASASMSYARWSGGRPMFSIDSLANFMIIGNKQLGVDLFSRNGEDGKINLDRDAMYSIWQIYVPSVITGGFSDTREFSSDKLARGEIIAGIVSTSAGPYLPAGDDSLPGQEPVNIKVFTYPLFSGAEAYCVQQGAGLAVARSESDQEKAAVILLEWLTRPEQNVPFAISTGYFPVTKPALQSQLLLEYLDQVKKAQPQKPGIYLTLSVFLEQIENYELYATPAFDGSLQARDIISGSLYEFANEKRNAYLDDIDSGKLPDTLYDQYINAAAFEEWYSRLLVAVGANTDENKVR